MPTTDLTFHFHSHDVIRESDCRMLLLVEITTASGHLVGVSVIDPRDYEDEDA